MSCRLSRLFMARFLVRIGVGAFALGENAGFRDLLQPIGKSGNSMNPVKFDHCVVHVSDWARSNAFYASARRGRFGAGTASPTGSATRSSICMDRAWRPCRSRAIRCVLATATCASNGRGRSQTRRRILSAAA